MAIDGDRVPDSWIQELTIRFADGQEEVFHINLTRSGTFVLPETDKPASWTRLEHHKCPGCPLSDAFEYCPAAQSLEITLHRLRDHYSHELVKATIVDGAQRSTVVSWPLQEVGSTFVQLAVFATACPVGKQFKPLLSDLRPFSTNQELSKHLIAKQLLRHRGDLEASKRQIMAQLEPLREVFSCLARRLPEINRGDAVANSIINLDSFALNTSIRLEDAFRELIAELGWELPEDSDTESLDHGNETEHDDKTSTVSRFLSRFTKP